MKRFSDWPERLARYIASRTATPFKYGPHDCARFANGAVIAQTGVNVMTGLRYSSAAGAQRILNAEGGLHAAMAARLPEIPPAMARRGDVGLVRVETPTGVMLSACVVLADKLAAATNVGVTYRPRSDLVTAFRI